MKGNSRIFNHLRKYRKQHGLTQIEVADLLGFKSPQRIILWEQGKAQPSILNLFRLSCIYGVPPHQLYPEIYHSLLEQLQASTQQLLFNKRLMHHEKKNRY